MTTPTLMRKLIRDQGTTVNIIINSVSLILTLFYRSDSIMKGNTTFHFDDHFDPEFEFGVMMASSMNLGK